MSGESIDPCETRGCTRWGFNWGPMQVSRCCYIPGRGYIVDIRTEHASIEVYVTEKGRKIEARAAE